MTKTIRSLIKKTRKSLMVSRKLKQIKKNAVLLGTEQTIGPQAMVCLYDGAKKENVILHEHSELFGIINCHAGGKVIMHPWSKLGTGAKIISVNRVEIGKDTAIATGVEIIDNNNHPINPVLCDNGVITCVRPVGSSFCSFDAGFNLLAISLFTSTQSSKYFSSHASNTFGDALSAGMFSDSPLLSRRPLTMVPFELWSVMT